ncbi:hypothetical protein [Streptomyces sp. NPDC005548]|uniref:hypothetical protein n=1 Tax=Streptomyces sp. NPDC005548 TaxID=3364724 RepID=UPI00368C150C
MAFPLSDAGARDEERQARRSVAYQIAAHESTPFSVQMAAAEALGLIDQGLDRKQAQEVIRVVSEAVRECRSGYVDLKGDETH